MKKEYILCAAIHFDDQKEYVHQPKNITTGFVVCGRRHHNCFALFSAIKSHRGTTDDDLRDYPSHKHTVQGFLTSKDRFINREEAAKLALETGQIKESVGILFSEHLY